MKSNHKKEQDDLSYLAEQGYMLTGTDEGDLQRVRKRVRKRTGKRNAAVSIVSLAIGIVIGITVMLLSRGTPVEESTAGPIPVSDSSERPAIVTLDTVTAVAEKFIRPRVASVKKPARKKPEAPVTASDNEEVEPLASRVPQLHKAKEEEPRFTINSPVIYIHDLKVTDYTRLYFGPVTRPLRHGTPASNERDDRSQAPAAYLHEELAEALLLFRKQQYAASQAKLIQVATHNKQDINCEFYLGMCAFYRKNYSAAIPHFDACISHANNAFAEESMYYKALCHLSSGQEKEARVLLRKIVEANGFYAEKARVAASQGEE